MPRGIVRERLQDRRVGVQIDLTGAAERQYRLVLERPEPSLCLVDPGLEIDLAVTADMVALHRVWTGELDLSNALGEESIQIEGPAALRRAFPGWLALGYVDRRRVLAHPA